MPINTSSPTAAAKTERRPSPHSTSAGSMSNCRIDPSARTALPTDWQAKPRVAIVADGSASDAVNYAEDTIRAGQASA